MTTTTLTFDLDVRATPEQVWGALTEPAMVPQWRMGMNFDTDWRAGTRFTTRAPAGVGTVLTAAPHRQLVYDWEQQDAPEANGGHRSTVSFELIGAGETTHVTVTHSNLEPDGEFCRVVAGGWPVLLSTLKGLLEGDEPPSHPSSG
jgi:uncharacterized protein YndB with AHSA1/START domain